MQISLMQAPPLAQGCGALQQQDHAVGGDHPQHQDAQPSNLRQGTGSVEQWASIKVCEWLTMTPACLTASGRASRPTPMFPLRRWASVWKLLQRTKPVSESVSQSVSQFTDT